MDGALLAQVQAEARGDDPLELMGAAVRVADGMAETADELVVHFVDQARRAGCSWTEIGARLGVSKQAARKRFLDRLDAPTLPMRPRLGRCLLQATDEARHDGSLEVTALHVLLGLLREGVAGSVLRDLGATEDRLRPLVQRRLGDPSGPGPDPPPQSSEVVEYLAGAADLCQRKNVVEVGTEHLLFVMAVDRGSSVQLVLHDLGVTAADVKRGLQSCLEPCRPPLSNRLRLRRRPYASSH